MPVNSRSCCRDVSPLPRSHLCTSHNGSRGFLQCFKAARWEIHSRSTSSAVGAVSYLRPSASPDRAAARGDSRRAISLPRSAGPSPHDLAAAPLVRIRVPTSAPLSMGAGGVSPSPLGRSRSAGEFSPLRSGSWPPSSEVRAQPSRSPEAAAIWVPRSRRGDTLFSPQPLFVAHWRFHRICRADFRSLERVLQLAFGAWRCYYFIRPPFTAPEHRARCAASSAAGHAPRLKMIVVAILN
ncbi:hypothetical protein NDU88_006417 [Pleurodeles waltl]|uniref:Uncharacterized protein n=1 Tax=Pleurodeles waltl TaxID=8319 RepID=A0AAV7TDJ2_PLEWA|nr:hypothetical protein NDU88_006417 [Pleurodeles waltl]